LTFVDPDLDLIHSLQTGKDSALNELMARHKESVFRYVLRYTNNEAVAEDITEETFVKVYFSVNKFKPIAKVKTWIFKIASNLCHDHFRKNKKHDNLSMDDDENALLKDRLEESGKSSSDEVTMNELENAVKKGINKLPEKLKVPFVFVILEEHSYQECAGMLNCSVKTVETRIYRARKILRVLIEPVLLDA
jgi:RNA polymerase sigma-70 factor, ECF subfamily